MSYANGGTHGWFVIKRVEITRRYNGPQPSRHTFYILLDLHIRMLRIRMGDRHEDLILGRRRCLGALRHGWLLTDLSCGSGTGVNLIKAGLQISAALRIGCVKTCIAGGQRFEGTIVE